MSHWFFLSFGFAMLLILQKKEPEDGAHLKQVLQRGIRDGLELFGECLFLLALYFSGRLFFVPEAYEKEAMLILFLIFPYGFGRLRRQEGVFFLAVFGFCFFIANQGVPHSFSAGVQIAAGLSASFTLFWVLMAGLQKKLLFSSVPKPFKGWPVLLITASLLAMVFSGFQRVFFP